MSNVFYCLVVGSRTFDNYSYMCNILDSVLKNKSEVVIVSGGAKGADRLSERYARERGYSLKVFKADWSKGKSAGFIRNDEMHKYIAQYPNRGVVAFLDGESEGTYHSVKLSEKYHNPLALINYSTGNIRYFK